MYLYFNVINFQSKQSLFTSNEFIEIYARLPASSFRTVTVIAIIPMKSIPFFSYL